MPCHAPALSRRLTRPEARAISTSPWFVLAAMLTVGPAVKSLPDRSHLPANPNDSGGHGRAAQCGVNLHARRQGTSTAEHRRRMHAPLVSPSTRRASSAQQIRACGAMRHASAAGLYVCNQKFKRPISSLTDTRFLHIPREMAESLIPDVMAYQIVRSGQKKRPFRLNSKGLPVFAACMSIIDQDGRRWPILYRTYVTGNQYHRRLTAGWGPFVIHHALTPGDAVEFWRQADDECMEALVMRAYVVRGGLR